VGASRLPIDLSPAVPCLKSQVANGHVHSGRIRSNAGWYRETPATEVTRIQAADFVIVAIDSREFPCDRTFRLASSSRFEKMEQNMEFDPIQDVITARIRETAALLDQLLSDREYHDAVTCVGSVMATALRSGHRVFFFGNGGSAADAQHLAAELSGRFLQERQSLAGWALTTNTSALTAIGNDYSFDLVFSRQIEGLGASGDVAFGITTSGMSANVLRAMEIARQKKLITVCLTGGNGGNVRNLVDHCICIRSSQTPRIQEAHILTGHILCELMERELFG
jgi:D-sedoheptulose 7-phosphate isomerase